MRTLLVEDDVEQAANVTEGLALHGFVVESVAEAEAAEAALRCTAYDLAILDIGLPRMDGLELLRRSRARGMKLPILMLTALDAVEDRARGLDLGADDYLVKPFSLVELLARCRAVVRRSHAAASSIIEFGRLRIDVGAQVAHVDETPLDLTAREWAVLQRLVLASPKVVAKRQLVDSLGRWDREITDNAVEIYVSRLRVKLADAALMIRTVRGIGYRLDEGASAA
jgi:DNA-binding response OmpR family regulator